MNDDFSILHGALEAQGVKTSLNSRIYMLLSKLGATHCTVTCISEVAVFEAERAIHIVRLPNCSRRRQLFINPLNLIDTQESLRQLGRNNIISTATAANILQTTNLFIIADAWLHLLG